MISTIDEIKTAIGISEDTDTYDNFIEANLSGVQDFIFHYTNNNFSNKNVYVSGKAICAKTGTIQIADKSLLAEGFYEECYLWIEGSLANDGLFRVKSISSDTFTVDDLDTVIDENSSELAYVYRADIPKTIRLAAAKMIQFLMRSAGLIDKEIEAERIGDYQVTYSRNSGNNEATYPPVIIQMLTPYCKPGFVEAP